MSLYTPEWDAWLADDRAAEARHDEWQDLAREADRDE